MYSKEYIDGFMDKLAEYEKSAKLLHEMTKEERATAMKLRNAERNRIEAQYPKRIEEDPLPENIGEDIVLAGKKLKRKLTSLGRGALSALGVTGIRTGQSLVDLATWLPKLADEIVFGKLIGVDDGRGFLGRHFGKMNRSFDKAVHATRKWSEDYDYTNRIDSKLNRFLQGAAADAVGTFAGFGGLGALASKGPTKALGLLFGIPAGASTLFTGDAKELRDREEKIRSIPAKYRRFYDPTSTASNQYRDPTPEEYRRYHLDIPYRPAMWGGKIKLPYKLTHNEDNFPVMTHEYGTYDE